MNAIVQDLLVFAIVAIAMSYAGLKLMPAAWRKSLASHAALLAARSGLSDAQVRRVEAKLSTSGACGSCDSCKACATPRKESDGATFVAASPSNFKTIPIRRAS